MGKILPNRDDLVLLAPSYGNTLMFYGHVAGTWWPEDAANPQAELASIRREHGASFFVVTDMAAWHRDTGLREYLERLPLVDQGTGYRVYDLRRSQ
jgi:hypothetical protein